MRVKISYESKNILKIDLKMAEARNDAYSTAFIRKVKLDFLSEPPHSEPFHIAPKRMVLSHKKYLVQVIAEKGDFFSSVLLRVKKYGSYRMILNLKKLNKYIDSKYFKMKLESLQNVWHIVTPKVWMASVDLKDAYFSVPT